MSDRIRRNPNFIPQLRRQPAVHRQIKDGAREAKRKAQAIAPDNTGYYKRRFRIFGRAGRYVLANIDPFAHLVESGSANNPVYAPLRRGVRAAGIRLEEGPRAVRTVAGALEGGAEWSD